MMEMKDIGHKSEMPAQPTEGKQETKISYPGFSITGDQIPDELGNIKNGDKCRCEIVVRKIGDNIDTYAKGEPRRIELEIHKLGFAGKGKVSEDEYKNMSDEEKDKADEEEVMSEEK
jgi:hypothetical protein